MKKMKMIVLAAAFLAAVAVPVSAKAQSVVDQIAATVLAEKFGIPVRDVFGVSRSSQLDVFDLPPLFSIARQTRRSTNDVWRLRNEGLGWGEIAHRLGMHPGTFNKLRKQGAFDRDTFWSSVYRDRYHVSNADLMAIQRRGGSQRDMLPAVIIARQSRISPLSVYDRYRKNGDWDKTAVSYKVNLHKNGKSSSGHSVNTMRSTDRHGSTKSSGGHMGSGSHTDVMHGKGSSKGKGGGSDKGQGHGKGHGKGGG
jgi:hypothetical protein